MFYGSGRLIDVREGLNLRLSFDAARFLLRLGDWSLDGFLSKPVQNGLGVFDNRPDPNISLWGIYAGRRGGHWVACLPKSADNYADSPKL
jgi:hypothetical protein